ncbi:Patched family protein [archaeon SCG-AAA382B04]|nr:Patched family protein [archaeon SCG-AAA382B04]
MKKRTSRFITQNSKLIILLFLILSAGFVYGTTEVGMESDLGQFRSDSPEVEAQDYITQNFTSASQNQTSTQIIIKEKNVLDRETLLEILEFEKKLYDNELVNQTLTNQSQPITSIANLLAINSIQDEKINKINNLSKQVEDIKREVTEDRKLAFNLLNRTRETQKQLDQLNQSYQLGRINKTTYLQTRDLLEQNLSEIDIKAKKNLNNTQYNQFKSIKSSILTLKHKIDILNIKYQSNQVNSTFYETKLSEYQAGIKQNYSKISLLFQDKVKEINIKLEKIQELKTSLQNFTIPTITEQIDQINSLNEEELKNTISSVFNNTERKDFNPFTLMPLDFDSNKTITNATMLLVFQNAPKTSEVGQTTSEKIMDAQKKIRSISKNHITDGDMLVLGQGLVSDEIDRSMTDSLQIVLPIAVLFVLTALIIAYRDFLDVLLGLFGIFLVLAWTIGSMGLLDIKFNQMFVAIPALLTGLSIDYAIHVFMRHREERHQHPEEDSRKAMKIALSSVGIALIWVTATTIIGFMSNVTSPVPPIREFGIISSIGIFSALLILGVFIPSIKVELDGFLEKRGWDRKKRAFGTSGIVKSFLSIGATIAKKKPYLVIILVLLITLASGYGATKVDTTFKERDFLAQQPPGWMDILPQGFEPGEYYIKQNLDYLNQNFLRQDQRAQILIKGEVDSENAIKSLNKIQELAKQKNSTIKFSDGSVKIESPLVLINQVSEKNNSLNKTLAKADTDGDGLPNRNVSLIYSELINTTPEEANRLIYKSEKGYEALRVIILVKGTASYGDITTDMKEIASQVDEYEQLNATATGSPVMFHVVENQIFNTVIESLVVALIAILFFITIAFKLVEGNAKLGAITMLPVLIIVVWIVGTMYALKIPFNVMTAAITNLTLGLGIDYSIHISERFKYEWDNKGRDIYNAMQKTVTGTGGALLGTAATTIGGFGVLSLAILPVLKQFGMITAITMLYSFIAGVFILPSLLILWARSKGTKTEKKIDSENPVVIRNLSKSYGKTKALKDIDLEIQKEEVFGCLGPNGAGKTTIMNILTGAIKKYNGKVKIFGKEIKNSSEIKQKIGYLPENTGYYKNMTGYGFLKHLGKLSRLNEYEASKRAYKWLERVGLDGWGDKKISEYSKGMKKRLGLAQAFIHDPEIILLDEPLANLDPVAREKVLDIIKNFSEDKTIIISTTDLGELNEVLDNVAVLKEGMIIDKKTIDEIGNLEEYYRELIEE